MDYDDLLVHLRDALVDPSTGADARSRVRSRYRVVLVDEFQDTDPVQWEILESAFHGHRTLVLIGDPKQAIYAFRGADVVTYLRGHRRRRGDRDARHQLAQRRGRCVAGLDARARRRRARRRADHRPPGRGGRTPAAGCAARPTTRRSGCGSSTATRAAARTHRRAARSTTSARTSPRDVAADIVAAAVLGRGALRRRRRARPVRPGDVAVLVHAQQGRRARPRRAGRRGVPVVLTGTTSVFLSAAAEDWLTLLRRWSSRSGPASRGRRR